ncbi:uncharacterized protein EI97DRAFT_434961 [Westerdykella ornata]|uniref:Uncharacterized protein n=1 Tax=Westerdykella ornata TaxID=318751 RepID=A0A6A6JEY1_WESOR|nr:uncharacterized protein EI97DRAFT_434961 [Westerdykella ornata]KAF2274733.1 hypothetical protein EI97DRAFT_434961 [Westerdykella ornata]
MLDPPRKTQERVELADDSGGMCLNGNTALRRAKGMVSGFPTGAASSSCGVQSPFVSSESGLKQSQGKANGEEQDEKKNAEFDGCSSGRITSPVSFSPFCLFFSLLIMANLRIAAWLSWASRDRHARQQVLGTGQNWWHSNLLAVGGCKIATEAERIAERIASSR